LNSSGDRVHHTHPGGNWNEAIQVNHTRLPCVRYDHANLWAGRNDYEWPHHRG
jgi:hypothetical protein